jgi:hypothetical protein
MGTKPVISEFPLLTQGFLFFKAAYEICDVSSKTFNAIRQQIWQGEVRCWLKETTQNLSLWPNGGDT